MSVAITAGLVIGLIGLAIAYLVYFITAAICRRIDKKTIDNTRFHKIRIVSSNGYSLFPTTVYLDGQKLKGVQSVDYHISVNEVPIVNIELIGGGIEVEGLYNVSGRK